MAGAPIVETTLPLSPTKKLFDCLWHARDLNEAEQHALNEKIKGYLSEGAIVNDWDGTDSLTPLHVAASLGYPLIIETLIGAGANIEILGCTNGNRSGIPEGERTPLAYAIHAGHTDCVITLLAHDAIIYKNCLITSIDLLREKDPTKADEIKKILEDCLKARGLEATDNLYILTDTINFIALIQQALETKKITPENRAQLTRLIENGIYLEQSLSAISFIKEDKVKRMDYPDILSLQEQRMSIVEFLRQHIAPNPAAREILALTTSTAALPLNATSFAPPIGAAGGAGTSSNGEATSEMTGSSVGR